MNEIESENEKIEEKKKVPTVVSLWNEPPILEFIYSGTASVATTTAEAAISVFGKEILESGEKKEKKHWWTREE